MSRKVYIETFGCQMNAVDSSRMEALLREADFHASASVDDADLVLFNTCSIREKADQKFLTALGYMKKWKRERPGRLVAVGGCLAQQRGASLRARAPHIDVVFGTHQIAHLPALLAESERRRETVVDTGLTGDTSQWDVVPHHTEGTVTAMTTIMQGCDNFCAYCIVPLVRGREVSRPADGILAEVRALACRGVREVVLLGQNVNSFGRKDGGISFSALVRRVAAVDGIERIRFMTSHPRDLDEETLRLFADEPKVCPHLHLPIQSGSDRILSAMGRGYTRDAYLSKIAALRRVRPGIAFSTDVIVGFPGETDEDFDATLAVLDSVRFDFIFSFTFSKRQGTKAATLTGRVPVDVARDRLRRLNAVADLHMKERLDDTVGRDVTVLVEGRSTRDDGTVAGRTPCFKMVNFQPKTQLSADPFRRVRIASASVHTLVGEEL